MGKQYTTAPILVNSNGDPIPQYLDITDKTDSPQGTFKPLTNETIQKVQDLDVKEELELVKQELQAVKEKLNGTINTQLTGSIVKYRNIDRIALEPAETIRIIDNERKSLPNVYIYFRTAPTASNIKVSIHSRINPGGRYVNSISTEIKDSVNYKKIHLENGDVTNLYNVEFTNLSGSPIEIYDILIVEEL